MEKKICVQEVIDFQKKVIRPFLNGGKTGAMLKQEEWMGCGGAGLDWENLETDAAGELIDLIGPGAFKAMRFTPSLPEAVKKARAEKKSIVASGGSCLVTAADNRAWRQARKEKKELKKTLSCLPNLMQITDASLPLEKADFYLNIIEDSLFAEFGKEYSSDVFDRELLPDFREEGARHSLLFEKWQNLLGGKAKIITACFSELPVASFNQKFWREEAVWKSLNRFGFSSGQALKMGRSQVMFSFSGPWADMLRQLGVIPSDSCYLVVEPFHHFTETHEIKGAHDSELRNFSLVCGDFFRQNPYGLPSSMNAGVQGGIAFMPTLASDGLIAHFCQANGSLPHRGNLTEQIELRAKMVESAKVPCPWNSQIFLDGLNWLYHSPACRSALIDLMELWRAIVKETKTSRDRRENEARRKLARQAPENARPAQEKNAVLFVHLQKTVEQIFS